MSAFQICFVLADLGAAASFAGAICHAARLREDPERWISRPLVLSYCAAFVSECNLSAGLLVWPILVLLGFALRFPRRSQALTAGVGAIDLMESAVATFSEVAACLRRIDGSRDLLCSREYSVVPAQARARA